LLLLLKFYFKGHRGEIYVSLGGDRQRVISLPFVALSDLADNLGLELRLTEKRKLEEKEKIKNK